MGGIYEVNRMNERRIYALLGIFILLFVVLIGSLGFRQLLDPDEYHEAEQKQGQRRIILPAPRGTIYDRNGKIIARNQPRYAAVIYLKELRTEFRTAYLTKVRNMRKEYEAAHGSDEGFRITGNERSEVMTQSRYEVVMSYLDQISRILNRDFTLDKKTVDKHVYQQLIMPLVLAYLTPEEYAMLTEKLPIDNPIQFYIDSVRDYPYGNLACHVIGYVSITDEFSQEGVPDDDLRTFIHKGKIGRAGIEKSFDKELQGESGWEVWTVDPSGFQADLIDRKIPQAGKDVVCSIDIELQAAAEKAFTTLKKEKGALVAMDIKTGEVLAMVSRPGYNLQDLTPFIPQTVAKKIHDEGGWLNRAIQGLYPPGSTFKLMTTIAGLRNGTTNFDEIVVCNGSITVNGRIIRCHVHSGHGAVNLTKAITQSCNVYFYTQGLRMGILPLANEAKRFGYGRKTGIELDETGLTVMPDPQWKRDRKYGRWVDIDTTNTSIGQGYLLATPLQVTMMTASIAMNRVMTYPTIIRDGNMTKDMPNSRIGLSDTLYNQLITAMRFVTEVGTGRLVKLKGVSIAGKSGTSEIFPNNKKMTIGWFTCFAPVEDPQIAITAMVEPTEEDMSMGGGADAGPVVKKVLEYYFRNVIQPK